MYNKGIPFFCILGNILLPMIDLHPMTVHFPIAALWLAGGMYFWHLMAQDAFFGKVGNLLHIIGLIAVGGAILTGLNAAPSSQLPPDIYPLLNQHKIMGYATLWAFGLLLLWQYLRKSKQSQVEQWAFLLCFLICLGFMSFGAYLGGEMVYQHGIGVQG